MPTQKPLSSGKEFLATPTPFVRKPSLRQRLPCRIHCRQAESKRAARPPSPSHTRCVVRHEFRIYTWCAWLAVHLPLPSATLGAVFSIILRVF